MSRGLGAPAFGQPAAPFSSRSCLHGPGWRTNCGRSITPLSPSMGAPGRARRYRARWRSAARVSQQSGEPDQAIPTSCPLRPGADHQRALACDGRFQLSDRPASRESGRKRARLARRHFLACRGHHAFSCSNAGSGDGFAHARPCPAQPGPGATGSVHCCGLPTSLCRARPAPDHGQRKALNNGQISSAKAIGNLRARMGMAAAAAGGRFSHLTRDWLEGRI